MQHLILKEVSKMTCPICRKESCNKNVNLMKSLSYFSGITQRTLSAFHKAGIDATLLDEMDNLKEHINKPKALVLRDAIPVDDYHYERFFEYGYTDIVPNQQLYSPVFPPKDIISEIDSLLNDDISPISKMGMSIKLSSINTSRRPIERPTECIFFMS